MSIEKEFSLNEIAPKKDKNLSFLFTEQNYNEFFDNIIAGILVLDLSHRIVYANASVSVTLGISTNELLNKTLDELTPSKWHLNDNNAFQEALASGVSGTYQKELIANNSLTVPVESKFILYRKEQKPIGFWTVIQDISSRKKSEEVLNILEAHLTQEKNKLEQVLNIGPKISSILDINHLIDFVIQESTRILEADRCSIMLVDDRTQQLSIRGAKGLDHTIIRRTRLHLGDRIAGTVAQNRESILVNNIETEPRFHQKNRTVYTSKSFMCAPIEIHGKMIGVVNITDKRPSLTGNTEFNEVDLKILTMIVRQAAIAIENANYYRNLEYLATSDSLTGVFNHRYFIRALDQEIQRVRRYPGALSLAMFDIDDFKSYNDAHGHLEGDNLLQQVSRLLRKESRIVDIPCRYAGDQFALIMPETTTEQALVVAEKIRNGIKNLTLKQPVTLSVGIAQYATPMDRRDLTLKTDQALYRAKRSGKNSIIY
jgi:diguanylate cyclase (GGDEF)-like protein/PAS domain S-box-containing protein